MGGKKVSILHLSGLDVRVKLQLSQDTDAAKHLERLLSITDFLLCKWGEASSVRTRGNIPISIFFSGVRQKEKQSLRDEMCFYCPGVSNSSTE